jgi:hypothetical protein
MGKFTSVIILFVLLKFYDDHSGLLQQQSLSEKFPMFTKIVRNTFWEIFLRRKVSIGELSGIYRNKTRIYSREFVFFILGVLV